MVGSAFPQPLWFSVSEVRPSPTSLSLITTAGCFHVGHLLQHRVSHHLRLGFLFHSSSSCFFKKVSRLGHVPRLMDVWCEKDLQFKEFNFLLLSKDTLTATYSTCSSFFNGGETRKDFGNDRASHSKISSRNSFNGRRWTNILLAVNVFTENISGPRRFLAVYFASAISSSVMSYWFCKAPAVGASGAIFGLVGAVAVFTTRHRQLVGRGKEDLQHIAQVIVLNMVIGLFSKGIDNWGHFGGFLGGAAASWLLGPSWKYESMSSDGRRIFADRAPIFYLIKKKREQK
nr:RHOMBOID-like protein 10, chloroplastic isoform X1 [Quercus suber]POF06054.1 isoform 2 of rhomboid-like protein 10, chloroplastic [Quercus suber]